MTRRDPIPPELENAKRPSQFRRFLHQSPKLQYERPANVNRIYGGPTGLVVVEDRGEDHTLAPAQRSHLLRAMLRAGFFVLFLAAVSSPLWIKLVL